MKLFIDNDIAVKMAQWGLLQRFHTHLTRQGGAEVYVLPTMRWKFKLDKPNEAAALLGSKEAANQLVDFVRLCKPAKVFNHHVAAALSGVPSIDAGETVLFAAAANYDAALVDTGDKKALRALGRLGSAHLATAALAGRIACLEQTVHYLVGRWTFVAVQDAVTSAPRADAATHGCLFGNTEPVAMAALEAKVEELRPQCGGTLARTPFTWIA